jgi:hypothetical protein
MARWPTAGNVYPVAPKAYPASPKAFPSSVASFPSGVADLSAEQSFGVEIVATKLLPLTASQTFTCEIAASEAANDTPLTLVASSELLQWCRPDLGLTIGVGFDWQDQHTSNKDYTEAVAAAGPALDATGGPNSTAILTFNGTAQSCTAALQLPAPGTTPTLIWMILRQDAWTLNENVVAGDGGMVVRQSGATPNTRIFNGILGDANAAGTIGTWFRYAFYQSNSTSDFTQVKATVATGTSAGNNADASAQRRLGCNAGKTTFTAMSVADIVYAKPGNLAAAQAMVALLDSDYGVPRYGSGLFA